MLKILISIFGIFITILFVVGTHEFAHFITARLLNVKVLRFSIGFGKTLFRWRGKKGTEYVFSLLPLGGYVQMLDEREGDVPPNELHLAYNRQPFYKKFLIVLAGPSMNLLCALLLYWLIFTIGFVTIKPIIGSIEENSIAAKAGLQENTQIIAVDNTPADNWVGISLRLLAHAGVPGTASIKTANPDGKSIKQYTLNLTEWQMNSLKPDPLSSLGMIPYQPVIPLVIGVVQPDSPAAKSGLAINDKIIAVEDTQIKNWAHLTGIISEYPGKTIPFIIERKGKFISLAVTIGQRKNIFQQKTGFIGIAPNFVIPEEMLQTVKYSPLAAFPHAWREMTDFIYFNFLVVGKLLTGKISVQSLGGPITIFESAGSALNIGFLPFINFLAFLSIAVGFINFLPIPGLDGGHLFLEFIQFVIRRPIPEKVLINMYRVGIFILIFIMIQAVVNDILRLY